MYRSIATLIVCLSIVPLVRAQDAGQSKPNVYGANQIQKQPTPWVPQVPAVTPADYARTQQDQYMLTYLLYTSGYYGPSFGSANAYAGSGYGGSTGYSQPGSYSTSKNPYGQNSANQNTYTPKRPAREQPLGSAAYPKHEPLLEGLADVKLADVHPQRGDIVDARVWMKGKELTTLIASVNGNAQVYHNAERLTEQLQAAGLLRPGERVIGLADGKVYALVGQAR
jgi:hypothetical protein